MGITLATFRRFIDPKAQCRDLRAMSWEQAAAIYYQGYWQDVNGDELPAGIDISVFDMGVNAGPSRAVILLQSIVGKKSDGEIGPITLAAVRAADQTMLVHDYAKARERYYRGLRGWKTFGKGWTRRLLETERVAVELVGAADA